MLNKKHAIEQQKISLISKNSNFTIILIPTIYYPETPAFLHLSVPLR